LIDERTAGIGITELRVRGSAVFELADFQGGTLDDELPLATRQPVLQPIHKSPTPCVKRLTAPLLADAMHAQHTERRSLSVASKVFTGVRMHDWQ
jgi:hypothetical protein